MKFDDLLQKYRDEFPTQTRLLFRGETVLSTPPGGGVYIIYGKNNRHKELLYIGCAGGHGVLRGGFAERLGPQGRSRVVVDGKRLRRPEWFRYLMDKCGFPHLEFEFLITWPPPSPQGVTWQNPEAIERSLLSAWRFEHNGKKPPGHGGNPCSDRIG